MKFLEMILEQLSLKLPLMMMMKLLGFLSLSFEKERIFVYMESLKVESVGSEVKSV